MCKKVYDVDIIFLLQENFKMSGTCKHYGCTLYIQYISNILLKFSSEKSEMYKKKDIYKTQEHLLQFRLIYAP